MPPAFGAEPPIEEDAPSERHGDGVVGDCIGRRCFELRRSELHAGEVEPIDVTTA
jgi:hypothetical protein